MLLWKDTFDRHPSSLKAEQTPFDKVTLLLSSITNVSTIIDYAKCGLCESRKPFSSYSKHRITIGVHTKRSIQSSLNESSAKRFSALSSVSYVYKLQEKRHRLAALRDKLSCTLDSSCTNQQALLALPLNIVDEQKRLLPRVGSYKSRKPQSKVPRSAARHLYRKDHHQPKEMRDCSMTF